VQIAVPKDALVGWSNCYNGSYGQQPSIAEILAQCTKPKLLIACRSAGSQTWDLVAMAPREDVLFDCANQIGCTKQSNGVGWYFSDNWSWGFAPGNVAVNRNPCDYDPAEVEPARLCWPTSTGVVLQGFRCGQLIAPPNVGSWERYIFHAD
jgi:hypothetical protein